MIYLLASYQEINGIKLVHFPDIGHDLQINTRNYDNYAIILWKVAKFAIYEMLSSPIPAIPFNFCVNNSWINEYV